jgi:hypothetical protein
MRDSSIVDNDRGVIGRAALFPNLTDDPELGHTAEDAHQT